MTSNLNLEKQFTDVSTMLEDLDLVIQQQEGATFDNIAYIKKMRHIRGVLRREMMAQGIADVNVKCRVADEIKNLALELDRAMTMYSARGQYMEEFNAAFQLYDLLKDYVGEPEKYVDDEPEAPRGKSKLKKRKPEPEDEDDMLDEDELDED